MPLKNTSYSDSISSQDFSDAAESLDADTFVDANSEVSDSEENIAIVIEQPIPAEQPQPHRQIQRPYLNEEIAQNERAHRARAMREAAEKRKIVDSMCSMLFAKTDTHQTPEMKAQEALASSRNYACTIL